ncbi:hypothetical protein [Thermosulfurimonas dismutans]|uniref:Uncharacterized protein n=1 Tax=Thermosulfurimonas dismutans TaxID=999894 RepID=A0A179D6Q0_9BACT|nr:hypothetical protein [Thermosulfurimonas dismutans]OAQ21726.1 hypothetical protein TDIS_0244 [Thermosulfurimonas dismutans]
MFRNLALIWTFLFWASLALAGGSQEEKGGSFALISGLVLLGLLFSTALAGHLFLKRRVSRKVHHLLAYLTLVVALIHATYNIFLH